MNHCEYIIGKYTEDIKYNVTYVIKYKIKISHPNLTRSFSRKLNYLVRLKLFIRCMIYSLHDFKIYYFTITFQYKSNFAIGRIIIQCLSFISSCTFVNSRLHNLYLLHSLKYTDCYNIY